MKSLKARAQRSWEKNWPEIHCAFTNGLPRFVLGASPTEIGDGVPVFWYHIVNAESFEEDLKFLKRNDYEPIFADELLGHMLQTSRCRRKSVVLSIDDGALNLYQVAFPLLKKYEMKAVAFISPGLHVENDDDMLPQFRLQILRPCYWEEIKEMHESGYIDFQSHTYEHRNVSRWPEPANLSGSDQCLVHSLRGAALTLEKDFSLAKKTIEERLHKRVNHLAWPQFHGTSDAEKIASQCGYQALWCGGLPHRPDNRPGDSPISVVRVSGEFVRRLPGKGRERLAMILKRRYSHSANNWLVQ